MEKTGLEVQSELQREGLYVSTGDGESLFIAANISELEGSIKISSDACSLYRRSGVWVAVFPAEGMLTYEVEAPLSELVSLITRVYRQYRQTGGALKDAFPRVVENAQSFLGGR